MIPHRVAVGLDDLLAEAVDGADVGVVGQIDDIRQPFPHLFGGLVGEGEPQNLELRRPVFQQIADAFGQDPRFPATGGGQNQMQRRPWFPRSPVASGKA